MTCGRTRKDNSYYPGGPITGKGNSSNYKTGWDKGVSVHGAFKLDGPSNWTICSTLAPLTSQFFPSLQYSAVAAWVSPKSELTEDFFRSDGSLCLISCTSKTSAETIHQGVKIWQHDSHNQELIIYHYGLIQFCHFVLFLVQAAAKHYVISSSAWGGGFMNYTDRQKGVAVC